MRRSEDIFHQYLTRVSQSGQFILDIGGANPFQKELTKYRHLFSKKYFLSLDRSPRGRPDIWADGHFLPVKSACVDGLICKAVLEHVVNPFQVASEIYRVLKKNGRAYIWVPFLHPYHPGKDYDDYFRFTDAGIRLLLKDFSSVEASPSLGYWATLAELLPRPASSVFRPVGDFLDLVAVIRHQNIGWHVLARK